MKRSLIYILTLGVILTSCGGAEITNLDKLKSTRDSLKAELVTLNHKISELDTAEVASLPIVTATKVKIEDFVHKVEVPGTVETDQNSLITAEASGLITKIYVKEGAKVSKGQTLALIDSEILAANIEELQASLELADYMVKKQEQLHDKGVGVEIEYEQAKNQKLSLEKRIKTLRSQQGKTTVRAPFSGIIDDIMVNEGEMAAPQVPLMRLVNNSTVTINASMAENLLSKVNEGTAVEMNFPAMNDTTIVSVVTNKGNYIDPTNRTFRIQIEIKNNKLLLPNQFAKVNVTDFERKDAIVVDAESILQDTENNNYLYKLTKIKGSETYSVEKVFVTIVKKYRDFVCVEGNLTKDELIVMKGAKGITESDKVTLQ
ncbi:efflux RND transporter periplasmic adaptor subunit [Crocinitomix catalasitica]|uniref:efflux RND transporter periplasmic adaptor subunit n=1 Tax=Crocinitomix catalasitica TaxID=184607 RepID=UPI0004893644|nr:efflux RND transporter periplasmic adaptor subunit [Crocinitomix catalasitica]